MKLNTQETIRKIELSSYLISLVISIILSSCSNIEEVQELLSTLENYNIDPNEIKQILSNIYTLDFITSPRTQTITDEYKELNSLYNEILHNTSDLYKDISLDEPVSIFATYVYMYRKGYFSYNKNFLYSFNMKDFAKMNGLDVIRGTGVCRSISGLLTDIYNEMDMISYNLAVSARSETLKEMKELNPILLESDINETTFQKLIKKIAGIPLPTANHIITMVKQNETNYIFDPTNDGFLQNRNIHKIILGSNPDSFMRNHTFGPVNFLHNLIGQQPDGINLIKKYNQINLPTISYEEYERRYLEALKLCLENEKLFEEFHHHNEPVINQIYNISQDQRDYIQRLFPIIGSKKRTKKPQF